MEESLSEFYNLYMLAEIATNQLENRGGAAFPCLKEEEKEDEAEGRSLRTPKRKTEKNDYNMPYKRTKKPGPPGWIEAHLRMTGFNSRLVCSFSKSLTNSDVKHNLNRLLIPKEVGHNGLIPELGYRVEDTAEEGVLREGVEVVGLDRMGREWKLQWKWWNSNKAHILIGQWMKLVRENGLKAKVHTVQVSIFSYGEQNNKKLCFLILHFDSEEQEEKEKGSPQICQKEEVVKEEKS